jgi:hypothetical protein
MRTTLLALGILLLPAAGFAQADVMTIRPGMTQAEVVASWGKPLRSVSSGDYTYLFYANDCLKTCGGDDVVILERGQVVDAIARASYHAYDGIASSTPDRKPGYTPPAQ